MLPLLLPLENNFDRLGGASYRCESINEVSRKEQRMHRWLSDGIRVQAKAVSPSLPAVCASPWAQFTGAYCG